MVKNTITTLGLAAILAGCESEYVQPTQKSGDYSPPVQETFYATKERRAATELLKQAREELKTYTLAEDFSRDEETIKHDYTIYKDNYYRGYGVGDKKSLKSGELNIGLDFIDLASRQEGWKLVYQRTDESGEISFSPIYRSSEENIDAYAIPKNCDNKDTACLEYQIVVDDFKREAQRIYPLLQNAVPILQRRIDAEEKRLETKIREEAEKEREKQEIFNLYSKQAEKLLTRVSPDHCGEHASEVQFNLTRKDSDCNGAGYWYIDLVDEDNKSWNQIRLTLPRDCNPEGMAEIRIKKSPKEREQRHAFEYQTIVILETDIPESRKENVGLYGLFKSPSVKKWDKAAERDGYICD